MKVLIVDDNKQIISILEAYAKKEEYQTVIAVDEIFLYLDLVFTSI